MPSFHTSSSPVCLTGGSQDIGVGVPSGVSSGDLLVAIIATNRASYDISTPSGWTAETPVDSPVGGSLLVAYRVATSTEPAYYTWTASAPRSTHTGLAARDTAASAAMVAVSSPTGTKPSSYATVANQATMQVIGSPGAVVTGSGEVLVHAWAQVGECGGGFTVPSGVTKVAAVNGADFNVQRLSFLVAYETSTAAGTLDAREAVAREATRGLVAATAVVS